MAIKPKKSALSSDEDFERLVDDVVSSCGSFRPETVDDVLKAEAAGADRSEEPQRRRTRDPYDLLSRGPKGSYDFRPLSGGDADAVEQEMAVAARAARAGKEIPADVEEQMRQDREAAERRRRD
jgi:hypothetical protein